MPETQFTAYIFKRSLIGGFPGIRNPAFFNSFRVHAQAWVDASDSAGQRQTGHDYNFKIDPSCEYEAMGGEGWRMLHIIVDILCTKAFPLMQRSDIEVIKDAITSPLQLASLCASFGPKGDFPLNRYFNFCVTDINIQARIFKGYVGMLARELKWPDLIERMAVFLLPIIRHFEEQMREKLAADGDLKGALKGLSRTTAWEFGRENEINGTGREPETMANKDTQSSNSLGTPLEGLKEHGKFEGEPDGSDDTDLGTFFNDLGPDGPVNKTPDQKSRESDFLKSEPKLMSDGAKFIELMEKRTGVITGYSSGAPGRNIGQVTEKEQNGAVVAPSKPKRRIPDFKWAQPPPFVPPVDISKPSTQPAALRSDQVPAVAPNGVTPYHASPKPSSISNEHQRGTGGTNVSAASPPGDIKSATNAMTAISRKQSTQSESSAEEDSSSSSSSSSDDEIEVISTRKRRS
ncbi:hypothetical protein ABW19_dt0205657 [Dactylella cylindrospora]|nr:hypothetical protein ABW19_dt0205657 [Dactylella cylindrospora]